MAEQGPLDNSRRFAHDAKTCTGLYLTAILRRAPRPACGGDSLAEISSNHNSVEAIVSCSATGAIPGSSSEQHHTFFHNDQMRVPTNQQYLFGGSHAGGCRESAERL
jgi:hypothetical protein